MRFCILIFSNLLSDGQRTFTYDSANRLTSVVGGGITTQFTYNGDGDRLAQIVAGITTQYALDPTGLAQVLIETTSGQSTHYLPGLAQYGSNAWSYYLPDRLGSVRQLTDHSGTVTLARSYDPFGNGLEQVGAGQSAFGYTGEQMDPTGLVFLRARYYNPAVGRFLTADTMVPDPLRSGGWNSYGYSYNNPVRFIDPSGRCGEIYTGNIDMNASINQRCYELAEGFTNELVNHGQYPLREDGSLANLSDYNVHVLEALYATSAAYGHNAKVKFPNPKMVPLNQPFQVTETFMGYTDLFWLDVISGGANLCGFVGGVGFSISGFPEVGVPVFLAGEGISYGTDLFTIAYISQTRGLSEVKEEVWEQLREQGGEKGLEVALIGLRNLKILKEAIGAPAPSIFGLPFDLAGLRLESQASYEIRVVPNSQ